ncbi:hypothetical protein [Bifidobacterium hapali]|uniref:hypothetical protein n=1 Tax=Bifidobacterium hapali TaxID=1630172 RepID=UPI001FCE706A|nr:hypothetical protein [Bifidobacterium hapali]
MASCPLSNRDLFCLATENRTQDTSHALSSQAQAKVRKISGLIYLAIARHALIAARMSILTGQNES